MVVLTVVATWIIPGGEYQRVETGRPVRTGGRLLPSRRERAAGARRRCSSRRPRGFVDGRGHHRHPLHRRRGLQRHPADRGHRRPSSTTSRFTFGRSKALQVLLIPVVMILFSLGRRHLGHVRRDHALHPHLRPARPVSRLRHHRRRGHAVPGRRGRVRRGLLQSVHGRHRPGHRRPAPLFGPGLPAGRLGRRDGHRHRRGHALCGQGPQGPDDQPDLRGGPGEAEKAQRRTSPSLEKAILTAPTSGCSSSSLAGFAVMVFGILKYKWYINEIAGVFLAMGVLSGIVGTAQERRVRQGLRRGGQGHGQRGPDHRHGPGHPHRRPGRQDPRHHPGRHGRGHLRFHPIVSAQIMFVSQCVINFFVHSGTAQAALTIPIMAPLGDLVGITRQTAVFAFQLAEYINPVLPTSGVTMGVLGLAGLQWEKWAKWMVPLLVLWILFAALSLIPPVLMKWGPAQAGWPSPAATR
ncbi:MAG: hypothetical protein MZV63_65930 [Marinilabiliales bacterium]|nr:hypothetical protein [Marinilabiliales bacterium]